jgi:hypothetical protein
MKTTSVPPAPIDPEPPSEIPEPLWIFRCPDQGYDIALIPHSEKDRTRLKREAKKQGVSLAQFAQDEIVSVLVVGESSSQSIPVK